MGRLAPRFRRSPILPRPSARALLVLLDRVPFPCHLVNVHWPEILSFISGLVDKISGRGAESYY